MSFITLDAFVVLGLVKAVRMVASATFNKLCNTQACMFVPQILSFVHRSFLEYATNGFTALELTILHKYLFLILYFFVPLGCAHIRIGAERALCGFVLSPELT